MHGRVFCTYTVSNHFLVGNFRGKNRNCYFFLMWVCMKLVILEMNNQNAFTNFINRSIGGEEKIETDCNMSCVMLYECMILYRIILLFPISQLVGLGVKEGFNCQIQKYDFHYSLFDIVAMAFFRFAVLLLAYALFKSKHWIFAAVRSHFLIFYTGETGLVALPGMMLETKAGFYV